MVEATKFVKGDGTKKKIMEASLELFANNGYSGSSVRNIAKKVGIKESAIYNHYKNKKAILTTIIEFYSINEIDVQMLKKNIAPSSYASKGKLFFREYISLFKIITFNKHQELFFRFIINDMYNHKNIRDYFNDYFIKNNTKFISGILFIMMQDEKIKQADPLFLANNFISTLLYYRIQLSLNKIDNLNTTKLTSIFEKYIDEFWNNIKED